MTFIRNAWYVCAWPNEISGEAILSRTICGQPMVFFRATDGRVAALEDRCCHRGMPLSLGRLEAGTIRCGYHGLRFDGAGTCVEVPGQVDIPRQAGVRAFAALERYGWVWVWPGEASDADPALVPPMFQRHAHPDWTPIGATVYVRANYQLLSDNLLDLTHETYLHPETLGNQAVVEHPIEVSSDGRSVTVERWILNHEPAPYWKANLRRKLGYDVPADRWQIIRFEPPANVVLDVGVAPAGSGAREGRRESGCEGCNMNAITPETERTTWYFWASARRYLREDETLTARLRETVGRIFEQDRVAVEAVQQVIDREPGRAWISVRADKGQNLARRLVADRLAKESAHGGQPDSTAA